MDVGTQVTHDEWEAEWTQIYAACLRRKNNPVWAFGCAQEIMVEKYGSQPSRDQVAAPGLIAWNKLGLQLKRFGMQTHRNVNAWLIGLSAGFGSAAAQFALANGDSVISGGEWAGIAIQFISVILGTVTKFEDRGTLQQPKE